MVRFVHVPGRPRGTGSPCEVGIIYRRRSWRETLLTGVDDSGNTMSVAGPKALRSALRALRRASRSHSRKTRGSANRRKAAARLARLHARVASVRADALHKATGDLARRYAVIVAEDLNVAGMTRNHRLARAISDQGFG